MRRQPGRTCLHAGRPSSQSKGELGPRSFTPRLAPLPDCCRAGLLGLLAPLLVLLNDTANVYFYFNSLPLTGGPGAARTQALKAGPPTTAWTRTWGRGAAGPACAAQALVSLGLATAAPPPPEASSGLQGLPRRLGLLAVRASQPRPAPPASHAPSRHHQGPLPRDPGWGHHLLHRPLRPGAGHWRV